MFLNIFIYFVCLIPLVLWRGLYEGPKIVFYFFGLIGTILFWVYKVVKNKQEFTIYRSDYFYFLFLIILTISSYLGVHPLESIIGGSYRHQGVIFFIGLWVVGKTVSIMSVSQKKFLTKNLAIVTLLETGVVGYQYLVGDLYFSKPLGTIGETNAVFGFLVLGMYFVLRAFNFIYLIPTFLLVLFSGSRSAFLSLLMFFRSISKNLKSHTKNMAYAIVFVVGILGLLYISKDRSVSFVEDRISIWKRAGIQIYNRPILGYGAESGEYVFNDSFLQQGINLENIIVDRAHNLFLDVAMWSGIFGLIMFGGWLWASFFSLENIDKKFAFLSFLIYSMFQPVSIVHWILLLIIINI